MSKGSEYIASVIEQITSKDQQAQTRYQGAFLEAALSIVNVVESPLRERALVSLAALAIRHRSQEPQSTRRAA
jgi:hypothetical protein